MLPVLVFIVGCSAIIEIDSSCSKGGYEPFVSDSLEEALKIAGGKPRLTEIHSNLANLFISCGGDFGQEGNY